MPDAALGSLVGFMTIRIRLYGKTNSNIIWQDGLFTVLNSRNCVLRSGKFAESEDFCTSIARWSYVVPNILLSVGWQPCRLAMSDETIYSSLSILIAQTHLQSAPFENVNLNTCNFKYSHIYTLHFLTAKALSYGSPR